MSSAEVAQYQVLNDLLRNALCDVRPRNVLVLGCSTGNGLEHVDPDVTSRVVGIDINPIYLQRLVQQFPQPAFELRVHCSDLAACTLEPEAFDLIHAALVFEYVEWPVLLPRVASALRPHGVLSMVVQLPSSGTPAVTPTRFASLRSLESVFRFVDPNAVVTHAAARGLRVTSRRTERLRSGKAFEVLRFSRSAGTA